MDTFTEAQETEVETPIRSCRQGAVGVSLTRAHTHTGVAHGCWVCNRAALAALGAGSLHTLEADARERGTGVRETGNHRHPAPLAVCPPAAS